MCWRGGRLGHLYISFRNGSADVIKSRIVCLKDEFRISTILHSLATAFVNRLSLLTVVAQWYSGVEFALTLSIKAPLDKSSL